MDRVNEYSCLCPPAFTGTQCELDVDECSVRPSLCHNGATCTNSHGSYSCICVNGWTGPDCSVNIDDCNTAACFNGATCIDRVGSFYCQCTYGKTGKLTHIFIFIYLFKSFAKQSASCQSPVKEYPTVAGAQAKSYRPIVSYPYLSRGQSSKRDERQMSCEFSINVHIYFIGLSLIRLLAKVGRGKF